MQAITFADFFVADILTSMSKVCTLLFFSKIFQNLLSAYNSRSTTGRFYTNDYECFSIFMNHSLRCKCQTYVLALGNS